MLHIFPNQLEGKKFQLVNGPDTTSEFTCIGYASNDTFLVVGSLWDQASNRTIVKTFKFQDVRFVGKI